jgi:LPS export ABC transporter protein LptC
VKRRASGALLVACCLLLAGCGKKEQARGQNTVLPSSVIEGFKMTETVEGKLVYELAADTARVFEDSGRIDVVKPEVHFFNKEEQLFSILVSNAGTVNTRTSDLVARGDVHVTTRDSTFLETDSLAWHNKEQIVTTDAAVSMRNPKGTVSGVGLVSDAGLKRIEVKNQVQGTTKYEFNK